MIDTFVQTDSAVVNLAKVTYMRIPKQGAVTIYFECGGVMKLHRDEATGLLEAMEALSRRGAIATCRASTPKEGSHR